MDETLYTHTETLSLSCIYYFFQIALSIFNIFLHLKLVLSDILSGGSSKAYPFLSRVVMASVRQKCNHKRIFPCASTWSTDLSSYSPSLGDRWV